jgi:hypothetical protein
MKNIFHFKSCRVYPSGFSTESSIDSKTFILALMDIAIAAYIGGECKKLASCKLCGEPLHRHAMIHGVTGKKIPLEEGTEDHHTPDSTVESSSNYNI